MIFTDHKDTTTYSDICHARVKACSYGGGHRACIAVVKVLRESANIILMLQTRHFCLSRGCKEHYHISSKGEFHYVKKK